MKLIFFCTVFLLCISLTSQNSLLVNDLRTEQLIDPIGIDNTNPRFGWKIVSDLPNTMQSAYEITVSTAQDFTKKAIVWSVKNSNDQTIYIPYNGTALQSNTRYFWKVTVWDNHGRLANSQVAFFHTGLLNKEWTAKWIAATETRGTDMNEFSSPLFRKEFALAKEVKSATLFISSKGMYEAHINGKKVGNDYLTPGWTSYKNRIQYQAYDVTTMIKKGNNAIGAILGKGWFVGELGWVNNKNIYGKDLALIAELIVTLKDGSKQIIKTDETWSFGFGPIIDAEVYHGEKYDSRKEVNGWSLSGFTTIWAPVKIESTDTKSLLATYNTPVRKKEIIKPKQIIITPQQDTVLDFGQNMVGWVKLKASGPPGTTIKIEHAEVLDKQGNFYIENLRNAKQANYYTLKGSGDEYFEPNFTFQGWRYIRVQGYPGAVQLDNFEGIALYSDIEKTGSFECSNPLINQLQHNIQWGQRGNFVDVPTDCPQRDERLGWTGDAQAFSRTAAYNFNVQNFFAKWLQDLAADQNADGGIPYVIPNVLGVRAAASAGWADAGTIIPMNMYQIYGDKSFIERQYPSMKKWVRYMQDSSTNDLWNRGFHFGDWLFYSIGDDRDGKSAVTDKYMIAQCFYSNSVQLVLDAAKILGNTEDIIYYQNLLNKVKTAYRNEYVTGSGRLISGTQTAYVLALQFDMLESHHRAYAAKLLVDNIKSYNYHITTGFLGTPYICHVLSRYGYADIAYKLLFQETYPSWLYPVKMGATTIWERWDGIKPDSTFQSASMNSFNHYAYGAIGDWMYRVIAGIEIAEPGYKKSIIAPVVTADLSYASTSTVTPYGEIRSGWKKSGTAIDYTVTIPANTTSSFVVGGVDKNKITVNQSNLSDTNSSILDEKISIPLGSGTHTIRVIK